MINMEGPSDLDYYEQSGFWGEEPDPEPQLVDEEDLAEIPYDLSEPPEEGEHNNEWNFAIQH